MNRSIAFDLLIWLCKAHDVDSCESALDFHGTNVGRAQCRAFNGWLDAVGVLDNYRRSIARDYL